MHIKQHDGETILMSDALASSVDVAAFGGSEKKSTNFSTVGKVFIFKSKLGTFEAQAIEISKKVKDASEQICIVAASKDPIVVKKLFAESWESVSFFYDGVEIASTLQVEKILERKLVSHHNNMCHVTVIFE